jgi:hypothetical protein
VDSQSDEKSNPGIKRGIRIGSAKDGTVKAFIPDLSTDPRIALAEGVSADAQGDVYAAGVSSMGLHKFVRSPSKWHARRDLPSSRPNCQSHAANGSSQFPVLSHPLQWDWANLSFLIRPTSSNAIWGRVLPCELKVSAHVGGSLSGLHSDRCQGKDPSGTRLICLQKSG